MVFRTRQSCSWCSDNVSLGNIFNWNCFSIEGGAKKGNICIFTSLLAQIQLIFFHTAWSSPRSTNFHISMTKMVTLTCVLGTAADYEYGKEMSKLGLIKTKISYDGIFWN